MFILTKRRIGWAVINTAAHCAANGKGIVMNLKKLLATSMLCAALGAYSFGAFAEDAKPAAPAAAPAAAKPAEPAAPKPGDKPAAKKPAAPKSEVKATLTGKIETKQVKNKKGKMGNAYFIKIATAKNAEGKDIAALAGKTLRAVGKKGAVVKDFAGKDVTITGMVVNNRRVNVDTIK